MPRWTLLFGLMLVGACKAQPAATVAEPSRGHPDTAVETKEKTMYLTVGEQRFAVTLADTDAARAFAAQLPLTLDMADLNGNEKHADLALALPSDAIRPGTIQNGDVMLYRSRTVVVFYASFRSSYAYTRLGRVDEPGELLDALGSGDAQVRFTIE